MPVAVMVWLWVGSDGIRPQCFLHLLYNTTRLLRLLPWFSPLLLRLIPSPRPDATDLTSLITSALERSITIRVLRGGLLLRRLGVTRANASPFPDACYDKGAPLFF